VLPKATPVHTPQASHNPQASNAAKKVETKKKGDN
jgi:hypothetical protein